MKSKLFFSLLLSSSLVFISCKKEEETQVTSEEAPKQIMIPLREHAIVDNSQQQTPQNVAIPQNQVAAPNLPVQAPVVTKAGMNPPHGQPGHRCDIPVGASLSSPVKAQPKSGGAATITSQNNTTPAFVTSTTPAAVTAPGMNPPHGQPGHVCGTPVGSPLPTTTTKKETETETQTETPTQQ